ncbi:MAG TPA: hypothetical protein VGH44_00710 [Candidatus Saccharimonadia bacterium]|jgi:hypothetical protein
MAAKVPASFMRNYDRNRKREQAILVRLVEALEAQRFARLVAPSGSFKVDPYGEAIGVFLPRGGVVVWVRPIIDFHHLNRIDGSNIFVTFSGHSYNGLLTPPATLSGSSRPSNLPLAEY